MRTAILVIVTGTLAVSAFAQELTPEILPRRYPPNEDALDPGFHWAPQVLPTGDHARARTLPGARGLAWDPAWSAARSPSACPSPMARSMPSNTRGS